MMADRRRKSEGSMTNAQVWFVLIAGAVIMFTAVIMFAVAVGGGYGSADQGRGGEGGAAVDPMDISSNVSWRSGGMKP